MLSFVKRQSEKSLKVNNGGFYADRGYLMELKFMEKISEMKMKKFKISFKKKFLSSMKTFG